MSDMFRRPGMRFGFLPDIIRVDRAILYFKKQLEEHIEALSNRNTKTVGEYVYSLYSLGREMSQLFEMSGNDGLARKSYPLLRDINPRMPRPTAIARLQELLAFLDTYEVIEASEDAPMLRAKLEALERTLKDDSSEETKKLDVSEAHVVFVIMPFDAAFNDVWKGAIEKAAVELGMSPIRVDMINRSSNITDDIVESIKKCHLAIVDVSDNNPNVMFELGYTLALDKPNIIISQSANFLPFDIRNIRTIVYANSWSGIEQLRGKLKDFLRESAPTGAINKKTKGTRLRSGSKQIPMLTAT